MSVYPIILTQKEFAHRDKLTYPYEERGLQFGDGVYEVIRVYEGTCYLLKEHVQRLFRSAKAIKLDMNFTEAELTDHLLLLVEKNDVKHDSKIYLQITRGSAKRDHVFPENVDPNFYAYIEEAPRNLVSLQSGVSVITERDTRWEKCYIKSLNLLPNVLAKQAAKEQGCYEAILHIDGLVTECSSANVFLVNDGNIFTYPPTKRILNGCVRMRVEQFANDLSIPFIEEGFSLDDISKADELFLTSSTSEVLSIVQVDKKQINDGKPGDISRQLQVAYEQDANIK